ncbi:uncharacterized protein LOC127723673 [Mytilus californianus]|uniref:uncharacterized protein LOC127723673 n=1 Tax=Mytilus californianus TaxID=6549 RepID=UPI0022453335|nr:uncharacterized protein LOC127723673 [Mytilus californianus]
MSNSTREAQELLRLFKCVVDTGTDVLAAFAKVKLLPTFNGNFKQFLDDKKHEIFHLWQSKKLSCCECPPAGYNFKRKSHMDNWIFKKIYDDSGPEERRHIIRNSGNVVQVCLHKYITRNIAIDELDISVISFLLRNLSVLSQNETSSLDTITTTRSQICHAYSMNCLPLIFLNTAWTALENVLVDLADPSYKGMTRKQIKYLRKVDLEKEEITELTKHVEELNIVLHEVFDIQKVNNGIIKNGFTNCENQILKAKKEIIQNTDKKLESSKYSMDETSSEEVYAQQEAKPKRKSEDIRHIRAICHVEGEELDEQSAVQLLPENKHSFPPDMCFKINKAEKRCLLLELKATSKNYQDIESFRMALRVLIIQIALAGKIVINKPSTITLKLIFN